MNKYYFNTKIEEQSREYNDSHEMLVEALEGQVYVQETMHKVSTTQVTGEALKKVSVGGKGGFGSQGDARDQEKQVNVTSRVMVLSDPSQETFNINNSQKKIVKRFGEGTVEYGYEGDSWEYKVFDPRKARKYYVMENGKWKRKWANEEASYTTLRKSHGRDYHEFAHSNELDPSDHMKMMEVQYAEKDSNYEFAKQFGLEQEFEGITLEQLEDARERYDYLCGYKGAWMFLGLNGAEHRRYTFSVHNLINLNKSKPKKETFKGKEGYQGWEASSYNHNSKVYAIYRDYYYNNHSEEWLEEKMLGLDRKDCVQFVMWQLGEPQLWDWTKERVYDDGSNNIKAGKLIRASRVEMSEEYEVIRERISELMNIFDAKAVHKMECTRHGKLKFMEADKAKRPSSWKCRDMEDSFSKNDYYKNLRK